MLRAMRKMEEKIIDKLKEMYLNEMENSKKEESLIKM